LNTLLMGILAFIIMYGLRRISRKIPNVLIAVILATLLSRAVEFERNITADISSIRSDEAVQQIQEFNKIIEAIPGMSRKRSGAIQTVQEAKSAGDTIAMLDAKRDAEVLGTEIERLKHEAHICREKIRGFLFGRVEKSDGSVQFYLRDASGFLSSGDVWRIRVGNTPLDTQKLMMTGGGAVIGAVPRGLPPLSLPEIDLNVMQNLLPYALIISLLGFMEAISVAKAMSAETGQLLDPNQELIGQGLANISGAVTGSYAVSGSLSRSAVNLKAGAVSGLSGVFTGLTVLITLLFFTPLLYHLPQSVLSAIIIMAVIGLIDIRSFIHAWKTQWYDGAIAVITFITTLIFAPHLDKGIMAGAGLSLAVFLYKSMRPTVVDLSLYTDKSLHDALSHGLRECKYIDAVRFDGPLFFANASYLEEQITERRMNKKELRHIIIVSNGINDIDVSGEESLSLVADRVRSAGIDISLSGVNGAVMRVLERTGLAEKIGKDHIYPTTEAAIEAIHDQTHSDEEEECCPLTNVCRE
jgi:MFS superfamily sulfate permease-like transporter